MSRPAKVEVRDSIAYPGQIVVEVVAANGEMLCDFGTLYNDRRDARTAMVQVWRALGEYLVDDPKVVRLNQDDPDDGRR